MITTSGVSVKGSKLYVENPEALKALLSELDSLGYNARDTRHDEGKPSIEKQKKDGWSMWYVTLKEDVCKRVGVCCSCGAYIDTCGIRTHKHECEVCGAYTYLQFTRDSLIRFYFTRTYSDRVIRNEMVMRVFDYDRENKRLLLYATPVETDSIFTISKAEAKRVLSENSHQIRRIPAKLPKGMRKHIRRLKAQGRYGEVEQIKAQPQNQRYGKPLISIPYTEGRVGVINTMEISGGFQNYRIVKLYKGEEYNELFDCLPVPEYFSIYEKW